MTDAPNSYVSVLMPPQTRFTTSVIKRSLNPTWPAAGSTFDFPIYLSLAGVIGGRGLEAVMWDKDMIGKEYMGELFVGVDQWFAGGSAQLWDEGLKVSATVMPRSSSSSTRETNATAKLVRARLDPSQAKGVGKRPVADGIPQPAWRGQRGRRTRKGSQGL